MLVNGSRHGSARRPRSRAVEEVVGRQPFEIFFRVEGVPNAAVPEVTAMTRPTSNAHKLLRDEERPCHIRARSGGDSRGIRVDRGTCRPTRCKVGNRWSRQ